jgi:excisionase family DNA binding protein
MTLAVSPLVPGAESAAAAEALARVQAHLRTHPAGPVTVQMVDDSNDKVVVVPRPAVQLLARVLAHLAGGHGVAVVSSHAELTTHQAADLLNVSRPYLVGLLDIGEIEYRQAGTHRWVLANSLLAYKHLDDARRRVAAAELAHLAQDMEVD